MMGLKLSHVSKRGPRSSTRMPLTVQDTRDTVQDTGYFFHDLCNLNVEKWLATIIARSLAVAICRLGGSGEQPTSVPYFSCLALSGAEGCWNAVTETWWKNANLFSCFQTKIQYVLGEVMAKGIISPIIEIHWRGLCLYNDGGQIGTRPSANTHLLPPEVITRHRKKARRTFNIYCCPRVRRIFALDIYRTCA